MLICLLTIIRQKTDIISCIFRNIVVGLPGSGNSWLRALVELGSGWLSENGEIRSKWFISQSNYSKIFRFSYTPWLDWETQVTWNGANNSSTMIWWSSYEWIMIIGWWETKKYLILKHSKKFLLLACLIFNSSRDGGASLTFTHHTLNLGVPITQVIHPLKHVSNSLQIAVNSWL